MPSTAAPAAPSATIEPNSTVTFTITSMPRAEKSVKTLQRLMRLQAKVQRGLRRLSARRDREDNRRQARGGRIWTARVRATKLVNPAVGESFTIYITPQLVPDLKSVARYLKAG